jgi:hypothetical protein
MAYSTLLTPNGAFAVTPSDTTLIDAVGFYVGGAGNVTVRPYDQEGKTTPVDVTFTAPPVGTVIHLKISRIKATLTTATNIVAFTGA